MISRLERPSVVRRSTYALVGGWLAMRTRAMVQRAELAWRSPPRLSRCRVVRPDEASTGEPPWVWWRLGLLVSNPGGVGLLGSVERCFELGGWHVAAVAVEPVVVEPVDPPEGREFELVDVVPAVGVGPVDAFGLVEPVGG